MWRFVLLLVVVGAATYFLRPYIPWVDTRVSAVEQSARAVARQYGVEEFVVRMGMLIDHNKQGQAAPAKPAPAPIAVERAAAPAAAIPAAKNPAARPDIQPLAPRASRGLGEPKAAAAPVAARGFGQRRNNRSMRRLAAAARERPAVRRRVATSYPRRYRGGLDASEIAARELAAEEAAAARAAPPPPPPAAVAPAVAPEPAVDKPVAPPVPAGPPARTTANIVKEAASSGDELDRLMAGAVKERPAAPARRSVAAAEIDRKLADVDRVEAAGGRATRGAGAPAASAAAQLSTTDIKTVMAGVQKRMNECFRQHGKAGMADVKVEVAPNGSVPGTVIRGPFAGTPTGACVESKIKEATFPASSGLRFDYRLSVR
jgi:hypothetical protein